MEQISKALMVIGGILVAYAIFSRFYGMPSVALMQFRSVNFLTFANTILLFSVILKLNSK